jgi:hypothetical protein
MKKGLLLTLLLAFSISTAMAADTKIPGVKNLKEKKDGTYKVKCANGAKGIISKEETNICVFSKGNDKNRCDDETNWTVEEAAEFTCK